MARAMGLTAISTYVFWNRHEPSPGRYDFGADNDVAAFVRLAQEEDLDVILRPGPYVCAEWDLGGLPAWLLRTPSAVLRSMDARYLEPLLRWLRRLGAELAPLQRSHGGPVIAVQLENEYGAFGSDRRYLAVLRDALVDAGFESETFFTIDQPGDLERGCLEGIPIAVTFAPGQSCAGFERLRALRPNGPLLCAEYWAGWFDHWGEPRAVLDEAAQVEDLRWMLERNVPVNIYMFHGGTNFGFWNGANAFEPHPYQPTTTSYDYQAALDEAGRPTEKYWRFREVIARHTADPPNVPEPPRVMPFPNVTLEECAPLLSNLPMPVEAASPLSMEDLGQNFGFLLYRTTIDGCSAATLSIEGVRDYAIVMLDGVAIAHVDRRFGDSAIPIARARGGAVLDILVENCGRINYGPQLSHERKGITGAVRLNGADLCGWQIFPLPMDRIDALTWQGVPAPGPAWYRGWIQLDEPADTFAGVSDVRKGMLWINGRSVGRCWDIGPQRGLYVPGVWLTAGRNEVIALDLFARETLPALTSVV